MSVDTKARTDLLALAEENNIDVETRQKIIVIMEEAINRHIQRLRGQLKED